MDLVIRYDGGQTDLGFMIVFSGGEIIFGDNRKESEIQKNSRNG